MSKFFSLLLFLTLLFFTSCDPGMILKISTTDKNNKIIIYAKKSMLPHAGNDSTKMILQIPPENNPSKKDTLFFYGIGTWQDSGFVGEFAKSFDSIVIYQSKNRKVIRGNEAIKNYLIQNRSGAMKNVIHLQE